mmetsp:Transcript_62855/g.149768  ORF Transcript_62855/g.149768 Transcript_62855/m.149768 type:complete len:230 (+) Transcript_62855:1274-1963(+)
MGRTRTRRGGRRARRAARRCPPTGWGARSRRTVFRLSSRSGQRGTTCGGSSARVSCQTPRRKSTLCLSRWQTTSGTQSGGWTTRTSKQSRAGIRTPSLSPPASTSPRGGRSRRGCGWPDRTSMASSASTLHRSTRATSRTRLTSSAPSTPSPTRFRWRCTARYSTTGARQRSGRGATSPSCSRRTAGSTRSGTTCTDSWGGRSGQGRPGRTPCLGWSIRPCGGIRPSRA